MTSLREQQHQLRESFIIDRAHDLLIEQGYEAMNIDELAARVGISKATLYQHFRSKEEVAVQVIVRLMNDALASLQDGALSSQPALTRLEACLRTGLEKRVQFWSAHLTLPAAICRKHPAYVATHGRMSAFLSDLVDRAKREGDVNEELSTAVIVKMAMSLFKADYEDLLTSEKCNPQELVDTLTAVMINGSKPH